MGETMSNDISSESTHDIYSQKNMHNSTKGLYQSCSKNCEFQILDFGHFYVFVNMRPLGVKVSNDISSETTHQICCLKFMYTHGEGLLQSC